ncbi:MAG TPA: class I SAM-dependent methyltransferase [Pseudonocardia sp.]|nr:class I SAM-dependent methyltransferase [Pseudonocardia sp.]
MSETTPAAARVDPSNVDQSRAWDGETGDYWTENAARYDAGVAAYRQPFLDTAAIEATARVLDVGCGSGQITRDAARLASAGHALGVDLSSRMIELARRLAERDGLSNAEFQQADVQSHPFAADSFDLAISRTGVMFFGDPVAAFGNIGRALAPGGRLVVMVWQTFERSEWISSFFGALAAGRDVSPPPAQGPGPFSLGDPDHLRGVLGDAGFGDVRLVDRREPMYFGADADDGCRFIAGQFDGALRGFDADARARAVDALHASMAAHQTERGVFYDSAAWFVEARRP